jgi:hypothetical protein
MSFRASHQCPAHGRRIGNNRPVRFQSSRRPLSTRRCWGRLMKSLSWGVLPNLLNNLFERRFQVIKGSVHCFVFGLAFPDHSASVQSADEGMGFLVLSNFNPAVGLCPHGNAGISFRPTKSLQLHIFESPYPRKVMALPRSGFARSTSCQTGHHECVADHKHARHG